MEDYAKLLQINQYILLYLNCKDNMNNSILVIYPNHFQTYIQINTNSPQADTSQTATIGEPSQTANVRCMGPQTILKHLTKYKILLSAQEQLKLQQQQPQSQQSAAAEAGPQLQCVTNPQDYTIYQYQPLSELYHLKNNNSKLQLQQKLTKSLQINDQFQQKYIVQPQLCYVSQVYFILNKGESKSIIKEYIRENYQELIKGVTLEQEVEKPQIKQEEIKQQKVIQVEKVITNQLKPPQQEQQVKQKQVQGDYGQYQQQEEHYSEQQQQKQEQQQDPGQPLQKQPQQPQQQQQQEQRLANSSISTQNYREHIWRQKLAINAQFRSRIQGKALKQQKYKKHVQKYIPKIQYVTLTFMMDDKMIAQQKIIKFTILRNQLMENYDVYYDRDCNSKLHVQMIMGIKDKIYYVRQKSKLIHNLLTAHNKRRKRNKLGSFSNNERLQSSSNYKNNSNLKPALISDISPIQKTNILFYKNIKSTQFRKNNISEQQMSYLPCDLLLNQYQNIQKNKRIFSKNNHQDSKFYVKNKNGMIYRSVAQRNSSYKMEECEDFQRVSAGQNQGQRQRKNRTSRKTAFENANGDKINFKVRKLKKKGLLDKKILEIQKCYGVTKLFAYKSALRA